MAEVFGIAANGIGVAAFCVQIAGHVSKLKIFMSSLKEAPQELHDLLDEIALLNHLLLELNGNGDKTDLNSRCTQWCMKAASVMNEVLEDCQKRMNKRRFRGRLHFVMRDDIEKSLRRLERAKGLLSLGHLAFLCRQAHSVEQKLPANLQSHTEPHATVSRQWHFQRTRGSSDPTFSVSFPMWLGGKVWELYSSHAPCKWTLTLQSYVVLPENALVFQYASTGNLEGFRQLLNESPCLISSRDPSGHSPLMRAALYENYDILNFIIYEARLCSPDDALGVLRYMMNIYHTFPVVPINRRMQQICSLLFQHSRGRLIETGFREMDDKLLCFFPEPGIQHEILQAVNPPIHEQPLALRQQLCLEYLFGTGIPFRSFDPNSILSLIIGTLNVNTVKQWGEILPFIFTPSLVINFNNREKCTRKRSKLLSEAVSHGINFATRMGRLTPMVMFIYQYWKYSDPSYMKPWHTNGLGFPAFDLQSPLTAWARALLDAGVDLLSYGTEEKQIHVGGQVMKLIRHPCYQEAIYTRLIGFTYGPCPEDWRAYFSNWRDEFAGEFWYMVEHPELVQIPGAWVYDRYPWATDNDNDE